jgi:hypothetical protein
VLRQIDPEFAGTNAVFGGLGAILGWEAVVAYLEGVKQSKREVFHRFRLLEALSGAL